MGGRVLVIDGDVDTLDVLHTALTHCGHEVATATSMDEGLALATGWRPDLVITEFLVPAHGGRCVVETLRGEPATAALPVVVWTATALPEVAYRVERARGIYWSKPAGLAEILPRVEELVARGGENLR